MSVIASVWLVHLCGWYLALETCFLKKRKKMIISIFFMCVCVGA